LRHRVLRQVHTLPHRLDPRRRGHRSLGRGRGPWQAGDAAARSVQHHDGGILVRPRGANTVSGDIRIESLSRGLREERGVQGSLRSENTVMQSIAEKDLGTPASPATKLVTLTIDDREIAVPEGTSVMRAAALAGTSIPKLCATDQLDA